ncbi:MAG: 50S ribosomal protein L25 [Actinomycetota bacterium]|nr:50S ribosomal protein L25 [Actinomycetota bacterium]
MDIIELKAKVRQEKGKNKVNKLRAKGLVPANLYGYKSEATDIAVDAREFNNLIHSAAGTHVVLRLLIDGMEAPTVIVKEAQRNPVKDDFLHIDFLSVALDEKITSAVSISLIGNSVGVHEGGILQHGLWEVQIEALPTDLPDQLEVDISNLAIGESLHASDISLPPELTLVTGAEEVLATILPPAVFKEEEVEEEAPAAAEEEAPSAAPEASEES